jgi:hypothetical protein
MSVCGFQADLKLTKTLSHSKLGSLEYIFTVHCICTIPFVTDTKIGIFFIFYGSLDVIDDP